MIARFKEPANALTHLVGTMLSVVGLVVLIYMAATRGTAWHLISYAIFGASLILLYSASTIYHAVRVSPQTTLKLRKLDHMMIFLLIAGTYTPFCLVPLRGPWGWSLLGAIWGCAVIGMGVKLFWMGAPRWLSTAFYVLMGWAVVVAAYPLAQRAGTDSLVWLGAGGLAYTVGAVFYALKWPNPWPGKFGFHETWHLLVMAGSAAHFAAVLFLLK